MVASPRCPALRRQTPRWRALPPRHGLLSALALLLAACAPPLVLGPAPTSSTLQATSAIDKDPGVAKALAPLTPAQRDLAMRVLQKIALHEAPIVAEAVAKGRGEEQILAELLPEGGKRGEGGEPSGGDGPEAEPDGAVAGEAPAPPGVFRKVEVMPWSPILGPRDAKVTLVLYSDFQCPFCRRVESTLAQLRDKYGDSLRIVWRNEPLPFHDRAMPAARAAMAAARQDKFWPYHDKLFGGTQLEDEDLRRYASELGLDLKRFDADRAAPDGDKQILADMGSARTHGASGTPTAFINGQKLVGAQPLEAFVRVVDEEVAHADRLLSRGVKPGDLYATILQEMKETAAEAPPQAEPVVHADVKVPASAPARGPRTAAVTLVEFSDFQCPFCGRAATTVSALQKKYGGKLRVVYMHQPLPFHNNAQLAAEASMAAHAQGRFWEFHDKLFDNQRSLDREDLERYAGEVGLDLARFRKALDEHTYAEAVRADSAEGTRVGANGTPTFFINGDKLPGAQPQDRFEALIDKALAAGTPKAKGKGRRK